MALESGTYINSLVITNPEGADQKNTLDDHVRLIKSTLKNTFPNVTGIVSASAAEINYLSGVTGNIQAQIDGKLTQPTTLIAASSVVCNPGVTDVSLTAITGNRFYQFYAYSQFGGGTTHHCEPYTSTTSDVYVHLVYKSTGTDLLRFHNTSVGTTTIAYSVRYF